MAKYVSIIYNLFTVFLFAFVGFVDTAYMKQYQVLIGTTNGQQNGRMVEGRIHPTLPLFVTFLNPPSPTLFLHRRCLMPLGLSSRFFFDR